MSVAVVAVIALGFAPGTASAGSVEDETAFLREINALRASKGIGPLAEHPGLTAVARAWAVQMAVQGRISHNPNLAGQAPGEWRRLGENVGVGGSVGSLHRAFVASPGHYKNLVEPAYGYAGIGVVHSGGRMWVVEAFMASNAPAPAAAPAPPVNPAVSKAHMATRYQLALKHVR